MSTNIDFKARVRDTVIKGAKNYQEYFVKYDYLLCSDAFEREKYYIISGETSNFKHLTGIILVSDTPDEFFAKCLNDTLREDDFKIAKNELDKSTKGSIRRKIAVVENAMRIFDTKILVQEDFIKNNIKCSFATADGYSTIGFTNTGTVTRPKTLLKGNQLDADKSRELDLVLRKESKDNYFREIIIGDENAFKKYKDAISDFIEDKIEFNAKQ